jgi:DNA-binding XRE family transcriptional regulator
MTTKSIKKGKNLVMLLEHELGHMSFGGFLRGARASKDMSQVEMALTLGISRSTLCDIEKGRYLVSPAMAAKIAKLCGLSTDSCHLSFPGTV